MADPIPASVYEDAARADAARYVAISGAVGIDMDATARLMVRDPALRTIVESAFRAGLEARDEPGVRPAEIWVNRARKSGQPCVYGTRLPVQTLVGYADACGDAAALEAYPNATTEDLTAGRAFLARWQPLTDVSGETKEPDQ